MKAFLITGVFSLLLILLPSISWAAPVKVAIAANMQPAFTEIARALQRDTGIATVPSYASSGQITTQIMNGAPFELFLSADSHFPKKLQSAGLTLNAPTPYAIGTLVLWSLDPKFDSVQWPQWLQNNHGKVAIADPKTAPYGEAAMQVLHTYGLTEQIKPRLVTGESIGQTAQFVASGAAQAGFVAQSQVLSSTTQGRGRWVMIPLGSYSQIVQDMVLLKPSAKNPDAKRLFDYLQQSAARAILQRYGYRLPETP